MHAKTGLSRAPSPKPQLHSRKHHCIYNGARCMPLGSWVHGPAIQYDEFNEPSLVFEIVLYFDHNRACTLYRSWEDIERLRKNITPWKGATLYRDYRDARGMRHFLREALVKRPRDCALEYFLRRRMEDCGGVC
ncbi:hypothetical protein F4780DRAFT_782381 [Xylariomycetidae sp. FL0641]|nr:hypothetical protein F4780DRAFT_782381 [Xylariomycetidae sp. FL0641]